MIMKDLWLLQGYLLLNTLIRGLNDWLLQGCLCEESPRPVEEWKNKYKSVTPVYLKCIFSAWFRVSSVPVHCGIQFSDYFEGFACLPSLAIFVTCWFLLSLHAVKILRHRTLPVFRIKTKGCCCGSTWIMISLFSFICVAFKLFQTHFVFLSTVKKMDIHFCCKRYFISF